MALIYLSYLPPGVYTTTVYNPNTAQLSPSARVPVLIGEGPEFFTLTGVEMHRGSSATADDQVVGEDVSDQIKVGGSNVFQLTYFPVVTGDGTGTVTNDPTKITVTAGGMSLLVTSLNGKTGTFMTQSLVPQGTSISVSYFFKKTDTLITNENLSSQIPSYASLTVGALALTLSIPGELANNVTFALTSTVDVGASDAAAVSGNGTDMISIELINTSNVPRTYSQVLALIQAGIQTVSGGYLTGVIVGTPVAPPSAFAAANFTGGAGQSTNTVFKTANVPIVDGTNGGVVTTAPSNIKVMVNGLPVTVAAVDGATGLITMAAGVQPGTVLQATYYTNRYQDTSDMLPSGNVASVLSVGYGAGRSDFTQGVDFALNGNAISWGAAVNTAAGQSTAAFTPFDASVITTTLVDQKVYCVPVNGAVTGRNSVFTLADTPVDGSGLGIPTDDASKISVYVGTNPITAVTAGAVKVSRLSGASATVTLYNPPALGQNVYASSYRSVLNDHTFTLAVKVPGAPGTGTYTVSDELSLPLASVLPGTSVVTNANFENTGIVWPGNISDLMAGIGAADETVTLTFQNDGLADFVSQPVQASLTVRDSNNVPRITFSAVTPGVIGNTVTVTLVAGGTGAADGAAVAPIGLDIVIETVKADNTTVRTWQEIVTLFATYPVSLPNVGSIIATGVAGADLTSQSNSMAATPLAGGAAAVTTPYANRFLVTTSRTAAQAALDGLGLTGGATTPTSPNWSGTVLSLISPFVGVGAVGYLGQTYIDPTTALQFTIVNPQSALSYGYTQLPSPSYTFEPGDTLTFLVSREAGFITGSKPIIALPGLQTKVTTTLGMNSGDTALVSSFNRAGKSPEVGEFYYVNYTTNKAATDYAVQVFSNESDAYAVYGQPNTTNRLALAIQLLVENGASQFACIQVPAQAGLPNASDQSFIDAIQSLAAPLPLSGRRVNVIVPLSTSPTVQQYLSTFLTKQATARNKGEAIGFIGFDQFATAASMSATASGIDNQRVIAVCPNALGIDIQGPTDLAAVEYAITGEFLAAALAGLNLAANNDVATTLTNQVVTGFTRSLVSFDEPTKNLMAINGITVLTDLSGALTVRHYKTTNPSNALTSEPYVTTTVDFVNQSFRNLMRQFIGRKETTDLPSAISSVLNAQLTSWNNNIISAYGELTVAPDPTDPTTIDISVPIRPMFSLLYINITLTVNISQ